MHFLQFFSILFYDKIMIACKRLNSESINEKLTTKGVKL